MSIVIVGGNERMVSQYENICRSYGCRAKVYPKGSSAMKKLLGCPDLLILFTSTVSHKMMTAASQEAKRKNVPIAHVNSSSVSALRGCLEQHVVAA